VRFGEAVTAPVWKASLLEERHHHSPYFGGPWQDTILREHLLLETELLWGLENRESHSSGSLGTLATVSVWLGMGAVEREMV
jgi:hypothetical protein